MNDFFRWTGEPADLSTASTRLRVSGSYSVEGQTFEIPTREDYELALRASGAISSTDQIVDHPLFVAAAQAHWHASGSNGCVFASALSASRVDSGWETYVLQVPVVDAAGVADAIDALCGPRVAAPEVEVVSVVMPTLDDAATLARLLSRLGALEHWDVRERGVEDVGGIGNVVLLGVRAALRWGTGRRSSVSAASPVRATHVWRRSLSWRSASRNRPGRAVATGPTWLISRWTSTTSSSAVGGTTRSVNAPSASGRRRMLAPRGA